MSRMRRATKCLHERTLEADSRAVHRRVEALREDHEAGLGVAHRLHINLLPVDRDLTCADHRKQPKSKWNERNTKKGSQIKEMSVKKRKAHLAGSVDGLDRLADLGADTVTRD